MRRWPRKSTRSSTTATVVELHCERPFDDWKGEVPVGARYLLLIDGEQPVLDPRATEVWFPQGHYATALKPGGAVDLATFPSGGTAVAGAAAAAAPDRPLVVYEAHVRGLTKLRDRADAGTLGAAVGELPRLRRLGVSVLELLPVHQFDPDERNYWGYMPLVFGAVHRQYAATDDPATELADLVEAAHALDIEVWLDVVLNHTTEANRTGRYSCGRWRTSTTWSTTTACTSTMPAQATWSTPIRRRRGASSWKRSIGWPI